MKHYISVLSSLFALFLAASGTPFVSRVIDSRFDKDAYAIISSDLSNSGTPDIITASVNGAIRWYKQANRTSPYPDSANFESFVIGSLKETIHILAFDVNGDGYEDIISAHAFGGCPEHCHSETDGHLSWLENPKGNFGVPWKIHYMGRPTLPGHRLIGQTSHFLSPNGGNSTKKWIISVPVVGFDAPGINDPFTDTKVAISAYLIPETLPADGQWNLLETIMDDNLHACHEGKPVEWKNQAAVLIGCAEGAFIYTPILNPNSSTIYWTKETVLPAFTYPNQTHTGVSSVALSSSRSMAYVGPFHGNTVGYASNGTYRTLGVLDTHKGSHDIRMADFHGKGKEGIVTAMRTNNPGIYWFSFEEHSGKVQQQKIYDGPVCMMTVDDFNSDGFPDIASINWGGMNDSSVVIHYSYPNH